MKITQVTPLVMGTAWRNLTFVKVETDEGLVGVGEVRVVNRTEAVLGYLAEAVPRYVLGSDPFETEKLVQRMLRDDYMRAGDIVGSGIALIEMACWDIVGKALNQPVYRLLGGAVRDKIKAYANGWYTVERTPRSSMQRPGASWQKAIVRSSSTRLAQDITNWSRQRNAESSAWWKRYATRSGRTWKSCWRCTAASTR